MADEPGAAGRDAQPVHEMIPTRFAQCNTVMLAPPGMPNCVDVHACRTIADGNPVVLTAWKPSPEELVKINLGEPIYLLLWGDTMPPAAVTADDPFQT